MESTVLYSTSPDGRIAYLTLNRPKHFNAINSAMPRELRDAVRKANADPRVRCIVLSGAGQGFCGGYDLDLYAQSATRGSTDGSQDLSKGYDALVDYQGMYENTECFMEPFRSHKPTIAKILGWRQRYRALL
ncbi:hypothetical protein BST61_g7966 [Cercospora zeina]